VIQIKKNDKKKFLILIIRIFKMEKIEQTNTFLDNINQFLHNKGISTDKRLDIVIDHFNGSGEYDYIRNILENLILDKNDIYQQVFMFFCNKKTKIDLNQFYTPYTICKFMCSVMIENKNVIDPACGTGDLIKTYNGKKYLWDINNDVLELCSENYKKTNENPDIKCIDSIKKYNLSNSFFDYCCLNPPFGSSTVINDEDILKNYVLGKNTKRQEIGILFIERSLNLIKDDGILFLILPNGYLGNNNKKFIELRNYLLSFRIIAIIELPQNSFSRSGTGVSTSLVIIQKTKSKNYKIYIKKIYNIGYVLNKKNTPLKYKKNNGIYILDNDNKPILDNDLDDCLNELLCFNYKFDIQNLKKELTNNNNFEYIDTKHLSSKNNILDINRYLSLYTSIVDMYKNLTNIYQIKNFIVSKPNMLFDKDNEKEYIYLDIKQINTPLYNKNNVLYGIDLPLRAKYNLKKYDIIVSRLKGKISFTIILDDLDNIVCTNGFCVLRPSNYDSAIIIFANLFNDNFKKQHNSLCTGSIMESITDDEIKNIYIDTNIDNIKYNNIIDALNIFKDI